MPSRKGSQSSIRKAQMVRKGRSEPRQLGRKHSWAPVARRARTRGTM